MKQIDLRSRYGYKNYLEQIDEHMYILRLDERTKDYCRFGLKEGFDWEDHEYEFVDPSGGPFIAVDSFMINEQPVKYIYEKDNEIVIEV